MHACFGVLIGQMESAKLIGQDCVSLNTYTCKVHRLLVCTRLKKLAACTQLLKRPEAFCEILEHSLNTDLSSFIETTFNSGLRFRFLNIKTIKS